MAKILTGSTLSYGLSLPASDKTADGSMFFLTAGYTDPANSPTNAGGSPLARIPGLHIFSFQQDANAVVVGDQVGQQWKQISALQAYVSTTGDTMTGSLTINPGSGPALSLQSPSPGILFTETDQGANAKNWLMVADSGVFQLQARDDAYAITNTVLTIDRAGVLKANSFVVWHAGNDGPSSGLDADLLDSQDGTYYLSSANHTGVIPLGRGGTGVTTTVPGGIVFGSGGQLSTSTAGSAGQLLQSGASGAPTWITASALQVASATQLTTARNITLTGNATGSASFNGAADANITVTVNDSAKLGGLSPSFAQAAGTVVARDGSGYTFLNYINSNTPNSEISGFAQIIVTNGTDGFYRKTSLAQFQSTLGLANYVVKTGDSMTGNLNVNGIQLTYGSNSITVPGTGNFGTVSASSVGATTVAAAAGVTGASGTFSTLNVSGTSSLNTLNATGVTTLNSISSFGASLAINTASANFSGEVVAYASDGRLKKNVTIIENALDKIGTLGGYSYDWDTEKTRRLGFHPTNEHEHGLIAQEVQKVMPDAVAPAAFNNDYLTVKYERLVALLVAGMNEQQAQINGLIGEIEELKNQLL